MGKYGFLVRIQKGSEDLFKTYSASSSAKAHSIRSNIVKSPDVIAVTPVRPLGEQTLPMQFKVIIKRLSDGRS